MIYLYLKVTSDFCILQVVERLEALKLDPDILSEDMHEDWNVNTDEFYDIFRAL